MHSILLTSSIMPSANSKSTCTYTNKDIKYTPTEHKHDYHHHNHIPMDKRALNQSTFIIIISIFLVYKLHFSFAMLSYSKIFHAKKLEQ